MAANILKICYVYKRPKLATILWFYDPFSMNLFLPPLPSIEKLKRGPSLLTTSKGTISSFFLILFGIFAPKKVPQKHNGILKFAQFIYFLSATLYHNFSLPHLGPMNNFRFHFSIKPWIHVLFFMMEEKKKIIPTLLLWKIAFDLSLYQNQNSCLCFPV